MIKRLLRRLYTSLPSLFKPQHPRDDPGPGGLVWGGIPTSLVFKVHVNLQEGGYMHAHISYANPFWMPLLDHPKT